MGNRDIHTKKGKKPKKEAKKLAARVEPLVTTPVEVVPKHRKEQVPE
ncbi:MAG TPA: hypothetical protein VJA25_06690 [Dehalococcoidia bacterium]|nr:hypothetical protein [Dehalococcoidia bacterium]